MRPATKLLFAVAAIVSSAAASGFPQPGEEVPCPTMKMAKPAAPGYDPSYPNGGIQPNSVQEGYEPVSPGINQPGQPGYQPGPGQPEYPPVPGQPGYNPCPELPIAEETPCPPLPCPPLPIAVATPCPPLPIAGPDQSDMTASDLEDTEAGNAEKAETDANDEDDNSANSEGSSTERDNYGKPALKNGEEALGGSTAANSAANHSLSFFTAVALALAILNLN